MGELKEAGEGRKSLQENKSKQLRTFDPQQAERMNQSFDDKMLREIALQEESEETRETKHAAPENIEEVRQKVAENMPQPLPEAEQKVVIPSQKQQELEEEDEQELSETEQLKRDVERSVSSMAVAKTQLALSQKTGRENLKQYGNAYKDSISDKKRADKLKNPKSRLNIKQKNKAQLEDYAAWSEKNRGAEARDDRDVADDQYYILFEKIMMIDTQGIDLSSDEAVVAMAPRMEDISRSRSQILYLTRINQKRFDNIEPKAREKFLEKMKILTQLCGYYRVCKMIITDDYYSTHYDEELGVYGKLGDDYKKQRLSLLLQMRIQMESKMKAIVPKEVWLKKDIDDMALLTTDEEMEKWQQAMEELNKGYGLFEFGKTVKAPDSSVYSVHSDKIIKLLEDRTNVDVLLKNGSQYYQVDGFAVSESLFRTGGQMFNLRGFSGLSWPQEKFDLLLSRLKATEGENMSKEEADRERKKGLLMVRDLYVEQARYIKEKYGSALFTMDPKEAGEHADEILRDLQCMTNMDEFLRFCCKTGEMYDNDPGKWKELDELHRYCAAAGAMNANGSMARRPSFEADEGENLGYENFMREYGSSMARVAISTDSLAGLLTGEGVLEFLEKYKEARKVKWEGVPTKAMLDKAKELAPLATLAEELSTKDAEKLKEILKAKKLPAGEAGSQYVASYAKLVKHPGFVKLALRGCALGSAETLEPGMNEGAISKIRENKDLSPDEEACLDLWQSLRNQWAGIHEVAGLDANTLAQEKEERIQRFDSMMGAAVEALGNKEIVMKLLHVPDQLTLGSEYKKAFRSRLSDKDRAKKQKNKASRLYQKLQNAEGLKSVVKSFETEAYDTLNKAITKQAFRVDAEDYHDLAMFMEKGNEKKNFELVNLYLGKSLKKVGSALEGQDVSQALDMMAASLYSIDIRTLRLDNDTELVKQAPQLERLVGQVAAFERLANKHRYMDSLSEVQKAWLSDKLDALRAISVYYQSRKDIITDDYYKNHYNDELSMDVTAAADIEQRTLAENLVQSMVLGRAMMRLNGVTVDSKTFGSKLDFGSDEMKALYEEIQENYSNKNRHEIISETRYQHRHANAEEELLRLKSRLRELNTIDPIEEQKKIQADMKAVQDRSFVPIQRPDTRTGVWAKIKNRLKLGWRFLLGGTLGTVASMAALVATVPETVIMEDRRRAKAQEKRNRNMVPGREGEEFRDEVIRKDDKGEDIDILSDTRRGPLVWEKLTAGDPEDPPEVTIMIEQAKRGSNVSLEKEKMGHAMICLSYSRYNKATKRKERYQVQMGFYPGAGITSQTTVAMANGAIVGGRLENDFNHQYDVARRYQVKPGDINKILRKAEKYADKGYGYYKRNCTTFVVDMAKEAGLPIAEELKEDEMIFSGRDGAIVEVGRYMSDAGFMYMGANAMSSRMNKMDLSYHNFGQKMYTKEDLDRFYNTSGTADTIPKGYDPGHVGETLRYAQSGELTARYEEHQDIEYDQLRTSIDSAAARLSKAIKKKIPKEKLSQQDLEILEMLELTRDGGLNRALSNDKNFTTENLRQVHKKMRESMKKANLYYTGRLKNDPALNDLFMKYFSLCECVMGIADKNYPIALQYETKGDMGYTRYTFNLGKFEVVYTDENKEKHNVKLSPGVYEGYLLAGKTPDQMYLELERIDELEKIGKDNRTKDEEREFYRLNLTYILAKDFASANRYLLEKEEITDKDLQYAFKELPEKEKLPKGKGRVNRHMLKDVLPSNVYKGVIFEKLFGGFKELKLDNIKGREELINKCDAYIYDRISRNPELTRRILSTWMDGRTGEVNNIMEDFIGEIMNMSVLPAYRGTAFDEEVMSSVLLGLTIKQGSSLTAYLRDEIESIRVGRPLDSEVIERAKQLRAKEEAEGKKVEEKKEEEAGETQTAANEHRTVQVNAQKAPGQEENKPKKVYRNPPVLQVQQQVDAPANGQHTAYERQPLGSQYCWACVMSGLMNAMAGHKVSSLADIQNRPLAIPTFEESGIENRNTYNEGVNTVSQMYDGIKTANPAIFGDYIFSKLPDTAVRSAMIGVDADRLEVSRQRFKEVLSANLSKGPVGMLHNGHFVLVQGMDGDRLKVNDSLKNNPDTVIDYDYTIPEILSVNRDEPLKQIELVWLEDIRGKEQEIANEFQFQYDAATREFALADAQQHGQNQRSGADTILHKDGVEGSYKREDYDDVVSFHIYVPKRPAQVNQANAQVNAEANVQVNAEANVQANAEADAEVNAEANVRANAQTNAETKAQELPAEPVDMSFKTILKGKEIKPTVFEEAEWMYSAPKKESIAAREDVQKLLGPDIHGNAIKAARKAITDQRKALIGENTANEALEKAYGDIYKKITGKTAKASSTSKKLRGIKERLAVQDHIARELGLLSIKREQDFSDGTAHLLKLTYNNLAERLKTENVSEVLYNLSIYILKDRQDPKDKQKKTFLADYGNSNASIMAQAVGHIYSDVLSIRMEDLLETEDGAFLTNLAQKYKTVCDVASIDSLTQYYDPAAIAAEQTYSYAELKARLGFFKKLKTWYEDRMKMMSSPYYALLTKDDLSVYTEKGGEKKAAAIADPALKEFVSLYRKTMTSPLMSGKKKDAVKSFQQEVSATKEKQANQDKGIADGLLAALTQNEKDAIKNRNARPELLGKLQELRENDPEEEPEVSMLRKAFFDKLDGSARNINFSDEVFIKEHPVELGRAKLDALETKDIHSLEKRIYESIFETQSIGGKTIPAELINELKADFQNFIEKRKELYAIEESYHFIENLAVGGGVDFMNDKFMKTSSAKKLKKYQGELPDNIFDYADGNQPPFLEYADALKALYRKIAANGIDIFPELTEKLNQHAEEELALYLEKNQGANRSQGEIKEGEKREFPKILFNNEEYVIYSFFGSINKPIENYFGKNLNVGGEQAEEVREVLQSLSEKTRRYAAFRERYVDGGGDKAMYFMVYNDIYTQEIQGLINRLKTLAPNPANPS